MKKVLLLITFSVYFNINAQDLEPRFLSSVPIKTNIAAVIYGYSTGNILLDNSLPISGLNADMHSAGFIYIRSFKLFNKLSKFDVTVPYSTAKFNAIVDSEDASTSRNGFGDPTFRLSMIFVGDQALNPKEFMQRKVSKFKLGAAIKVRPPLGEYDHTKFINLGTNRWAFQFKTAAAYQISKRIIVEGHLSSWIFTENASFYPDNSIKQEPLLSSQLNIAYIFNPKTWASFAIGAVANGGTSVNYVKQNNDQKNSRFSGTFSYKLSKKDNLKIIATNGLSTNVGTDFTSYLLAYSWIWFDK